MRSDNYKCDLEMSRALAGIFLSALSTDSTPCESSLHTTACLEDDSLTEGIGLKQSRMPILSLSLFHSQTVIGWGKEGKDKEGF